MNKVYLVFKGLIVKADVDCQLFIVLGKSLIRHFFFFLSEQWKRKRITFPIGNMEYSTKVNQRRYTNRRKVVPCLTDRFHHSDFKLKLGLMKYNVSFRLLNMLKDFVIVVKLAIVFVILRCLRYFPFFHLYSERTFQYNIQQFYRFHSKHCSCNTKLQPKRSGPFADGTKKKKKDLD